MLFGRLFREHRKKVSTHLSADFSLSSAILRWQASIRDKADSEIMYKQKPLELCVFSYIADGLSNGDLYVE